MPRTYWKDPTKELVAKSAYQFMQQGETIGRAIIKAQDSVLPPEQRRPTRVMTPVIRCIRPFIDKAKAQFEADQKIAHDAEVASKARAEAEAEAARKAALPTPAELYRKSQVDLIRDGFLAAAEDHRFRTVLASVVLDVAPQLAESIGSNFASVVQKPLAEREPVIVTPNPRLESITVIGLIPRQVQIMREKYGEKFDLRFAEAGTKVPQMKGMCRGSAIVYLMADFIGHREQEIVKSVGAPKAYINGTITSLSDALDARLRMR